MIVQTTLNIKCKKSNDFMIQYEEAGYYTVHGCPDSNCPLFIERPTNDFIDRIITKSNRPLHLAFVHRISEYPLMCLNGRVCMVL